MIALVAHFQVPYGYQKHFNSRLWKRQRIKNGAKEESGESDAKINTDKAVASIIIA